MLASAFRGGVSAPRGVSAPGGGGCLLPGGCLVRGHLLWRGSAPRGVPGLGVPGLGWMSGIPACTEADTPPCGQNRRHLLKHYLGPTSLRPVIKLDCCICGSFNLRSLTVLEKTTVANILPDSKMVCALSNSII